jgi:CpeS-like protein
MLTLVDFFKACTGTWVSERTYHFPQSNEIERSHTEFQVDALDPADRRRILTLTLPAMTGQPLDSIAAAADCPGFAIAFDTLSEKGERVGMNLTALFVPEAYLPIAADGPPLPAAAQVSADAALLRGYYLRDEGYSEAGAIAGQFTYQPSRQILEMTTVYARSVAVDQMRLVSPNTRLRTIVTYQKPTAADVAPTEIVLIGFGLEQKQ